MNAKRKKEVQSRNQQERCGQNFRKEKIKDKSESYKYDILRIEDFWIFNIKNWRPEEYLPHK